MDRMGNLDVGIPLEKHRSPAGMRESEKKHPSIILNYGNGTERFQKIF
jgi:hypothetical protein